MTRFYRLGAAVVASALRLTVLALALVGVFGAARAADDEGFPEEDVSIECWKGSYVTGFTGHAGYVIDRMSIVCARWNPDHGRLDKPVYTTHGLIGRSGGGDPIGGDLIDGVQCPRGWAVAGGYSYDFARHDGGEVLHHFDFNCRPVGGDGGVQPLRFGSNSNAEIVFRSASRRQCADGDLVTGIKARHKKFILEWQLICTPGPGAILATKPAGPHVLRDSTYKAKRVGGRGGASIIVGDPGPPPPPPPGSTPPQPVRMTKTKAPVDVLKEPDGE